MSKYGTLITISLFLILSTFLAMSITGFNPSVDPTTGLTPIGEPNFFTILQTIWNSLGFFFNIMFFNVEGIPSFINIIVFWPLTIGLFFMIISLIRGTE